MGLIVGILLALLALILTYIASLIYKEISYTKYFKERKIYYAGNSVLQLISIILRGVHVGDNLLNQYEDVKRNGNKFGISMEGKTEIFMITDLELMKRIAVKDFDHFVDRRRFNGSDKDWIFSKMLVGMEGEPWKALRSKMSPTFTTGKIRKMFSILDTSSKAMASYFHRRLEEGDTAVLDLQTGFSKYTLDFIASAAFGVESKAFDQQAPSLFEQMGGKLNFKLDLKSFMKFFVVMASPRLADMLGFSLFDQGAQNFFCHVIKSTIKHREETQEKREDFIQLMLEARAGQVKAEEGDLTQFEKDQEIKGGSEIAKISLEDEDIIAQCVLFILGGFDTTQAALLWAAYNLAVFPEMQQRLFEEVQRTVDDNDGELSYDSVNQMEYMDMFISESLRLYSPGLAGERTCTKDFQIPDTDVVIKKGARAMIPIFAVHRDKDYFPDPLKFDPERFSPANKSKILPYSYLPFGLGPRSCIAMRLALVEVKVAIAQLVLNFTMQPSEKTPIPVKYAKQASLKPLGGLWLKLESRK